MAYSIVPPLFVEMLIGKASPWSEAKMRKASPICFKRQLQQIPLDFALASAKTQTATAVNTTATAMIATNSIRVNEESRRPWWNEVIVLKESPTDLSRRRSRQAPVANLRNQPAAHCRLPAEGCPNVDEFPSSNPPVDLSSAKESEPCLEGHS